MQDWTKRFIATLHRDGLKPRGYRKKSHTFSRERTEYVERIQLQGSSWNAADDAEWGFYLNAGVYFPQLPEPVDNRGFVHTHVYARLGQFDPDCEDAFGVSEQSASQVHHEVLNAIDRASEAIARDIDELRRFATRGRCLWVSRGGTPQNDR